MTYDNYTKFVTCSIAHIQQTKRYLRTTAVVLKIREQILQRICFKTRKNNPLITGKRSGSKPTSAETYFCVEIPNNFYCCQARSKEFGMRGGFAWGFTLLEALLCLRLCFAPGGTGDWGWSPQRLKILLIFAK